MRSHELIGVAFLVSVAACARGGAPESTAAGALDRTVLPIREPAPPTYTELDARTATPPRRFSVTTPAGAPNVVIVLIDDIGFGHGSAFGGPIRMPTLDNLAQGGLRYNMFHTTALCSPTRMALLTGRNHHSTNTGTIMETATSFPGNTGVRPQDITPLAEILRLNGYSTAAFGKYHETAPWEVSVSGPFDRWPTRSGFDRFYGFIGGETDQWAPDIYDGTRKIEPPEDPNYHFTTDMTNQAMAWVRQQQALTPDRPFFIYFATGATHAPHQTPRSWIERNRGRFDAGWDSLRAQTLRRQQELGVVPTGTRLAPRPDAIKAWDQLSADEQRVFRRQMEVFAGFGEQTDHEVGRLIGAIRDMGELDNTLVFYIVGDNGASAEGGAIGMFNENTYFNGVQESLATQLRLIDQLGGPLASNHMAAGWAVAGNTPFTWTKQVASDFGGTRNGMVIHWPQRIRAHGEIRSQFHHVIDIAPTVLEAVGIPEPRQVNGLRQHPMEGVSLLYTFDDANAPPRHTTQYFEMLGNRAMYHDGWYARTIHKAPWEAQPRRPLAEDIWELYDTRTDFSLSENLAEREPARLRELQQLFMREAERYHVLPIDDRSIERFDPVKVGRPDVMGSRTSLTLGEGMTGIMENAFINVKNRSHTITADVEIPAAGGEGVILAQGGRFGGWSLYMKGGRPFYVYNHVGLERFVVRSSQRVAPGRAKIRYEFTYDGGGAGKGGRGTLFVNGTKVGEAHIGKTAGNILGLGEGADVGVDLGTPVTEDYRGRHNRFNGNIPTVTIDLK